MKPTVLCSLALATTMLVLPVVSLAADYAVFTRNAIGAIPGWPTAGNQADNFQADMLDANTLRWTITDVPSLWSTTCDSAGLVTIRSGGIRDTDGNNGTSPSNGLCTYYLDVDNDQGNTVVPGRINMWSSTVDASGDFLLDRRQVEINELATVSIANTSGGNSSFINQGFFVDGSMVSLLQQFSNTIGVKVEVFLSNGNLRWSDQYTPSSGNTLQIKLPNSAICNLSGTTNRVTTVQVSRVDIFPGQGLTPVPVSNYDANCQNL